MRNFLAQRFFKWFTEWAVCYFLADFFLAFCACVRDLSSAPTVISSWEKLSYSAIANCLVRVN